VNNLLPVCGYEEKSVYDSELQRLNASGFLDVGQLLLRGGKPLSQSVHRDIVSQRISVKSPASATRPATSPERKKLLSPGPGTYDPQSDRFGNKEMVSWAFSFGSSKRPKSQTDNCVSPGPAYYPKKEFVSTLAISPRIA
jgi:hypothetical protein